MIGIHSNPATLGSTGPLPGQKPVKGLGAPPMGMAPPMRIPTPVGPGAMPAVNPMQPAPRFGNGAMGPAMDRSRMLASALRGQRY